jgi:hypothetical protein
MRIREVIKELQQILVEKGNVEFCVWNYKNNSLDDAGEIEHVGKIDETTLEKNTKMVYFPSAVENLEG